MVPYLWFILSIYYLFKRYFLSICYVPGSIKGLWDLSMNKSDKDSYPQFSSVAQSCPTFCDPYRLQHARLSYPSPTPRACSNSCSLSLWCHPTISFSVTPFSSCFNLSQHQGFFKWVSSLHQVAKVLEFQLQHQSFQWISRTDFL